MGAPARRMVAHPPSLLTASARLTARLPAQHAPCSSIDLRSAQTPDHTQAASRPSIHLCPAGAPSRRELADLADKAEAEDAKTRYVVTMDIDAVIQGGCYAWKAKDSGRAKARRPWHEAASTCSCSLRGRSLRAWLGSGALLPAPPMVVTC